MNDTQFLQVRASDRITEDDWYAAAVLAKQRADRNLKQFAEACSHVSDRRTAALAADCGCSPDTIERYRAAWNLYQEIGRVAKFRTVRKLWETGSLALWRKAPELRTRYALTLEQTWEYLQTGIEHRMSRDSFSAHVDEKENDTPKWIRRLQHAIRVIAPIRNDYREEMPPDIRAEFDAAVDEFSARLTAIVERYGA